MGGWLRSSMLPVETVLLPPLAPGLGSWRKVSTLVVPGARLKSNAPSSSASEIWPPPEPEELGDGWEEAVSEVRGTYYRRTDNHQIESPHRPTKLWIRATALAEERRGTADPAALLLNLELTQDAALARRNEAIQNLEAIMQAHAPRPRPRKPAARARGGRRPPAASRLPQLRCECRARRLSGSTHPPA